LIKLLLQYCINVAGTIFLGTPALLLFDKKFSKTNIIFEIVLEFKRMVF